MRRGSRHQKRLAVAAMAGASATPKPAPAAGGTGAPTHQNTKAEILDWLEAQGSPGSESMTKAALLDLVADVS